MRRAFAELTRFTVLAVLCACPALLPSEIARADKWADPAEQEVRSQGGDFLFRIRPFPLSADRRPIGGLYRIRPHAAEEILWERPLVNDVSPVSAIVAADGRYVATFDDWHRKGFSEHVVVVYDADGEAIVDLALEDFVSRSELVRFRKSISSIHWGGDHQIEDGVLGLKLLLAPWDVFDDPEAYRRWFDAPGPSEIRRIDLPSGRLLDRPQAHPVDRSPPHDCPAGTRLFERLALEVGLLQYCLRPTEGESADRHGPFRRWVATGRGWALAETGSYEAGRRTGTWLRPQSVPPCERRYENDEVQEEYNCP